jgi:hypothetical protein
MAMTDPGPAAHKERPRVAGAMLHDRAHIVTPVADSLRHRMG